MYDEEEEIQVVIEKELDVVLVIIIAVIALVFLASLVFVIYKEKSGEALFKPLEQHEEAGDAVESSPAGVASREEGNDNVNNGGVELTSAAQTDNV